MSVVSLIGVIMFFFIRKPYVHASIQALRTGLHQEEDYYTVDGKSVIDSSVMAS